MERAVEAGAVAHVLKPFHHVQLVETINGVIAVRDAARAERERRGQLIAVESMLRRGFSEREVTEGLRDGRVWGRQDDLGPPATFPSWIRAIFRR